MKKRLKKLTAICLLSFLLISFGIGTDSGVKTSGRFSFLVRKLLANLELIY